MEELKKKLDDSFVKKDEYKDILSEKEKKRIQDSQNDLQDWIKRNPNAKKEDIERKMREFDDNVAPIFERAQAYNDLINSSVEAKKKKNNLDKFISSKESKILDKQILDLEDWLKDHKDAKKDEIEKKRRDFNDKVDPILIRAQAVSDLSKFAQEVKDKKEQLGDNLNEKERKQIDDLVKNVNDWIKENPEAQKVEIDRKRKELKDKSTPILMRGQASADLKQKIKDINDKANQLSEFLTEKEKKQLSDLSKDYSDWMISNPNASREEIEKKNKEFTDKSQKILSRAEAMNDLSQNIKDHKNREENVLDKLTTTEKKLIDTKCAEVEEWIDQHKDAPKEDIQKKKKELNDKIVPILERAETMKNLEKLNDEVKNARDYFGDLLSEKEKKEK